MIQLCAMISAARRRLGSVVLALELLYTAVQRHISSGPMIQLGVVISAARLRLGCVVLALALLHTAVQRNLSSDPTIQLGAVISAARLRLGCVVFCFSAGTAIHSSSCLLYTSPSPRDKRQSRMPSSA